MCASAFTCDKPITPHKIAKQTKDFMTDKRYCFTTGNVYLIWLTACSNWCQWKKMLSYLYHLTWFWDEWNVILCRRPIGWNDRVKIFLIECQALSQTSNFKHGMCAYLIYLSRYFDIEQVQKLSKSKGLLSGSVVSSPRPTILFYYFSFCPKNVHRKKAYDSMTFFKSFHCCSSMCSFTCLLLKFVYKSHRFFETISQIRIETTGWRMYMRYQTINQLNEFFKWK